MISFFVHILGNAISVAHAQIQVNHSENAYEVYCDALDTYCGDGVLYVAHLAVRITDAIVIPLVGGIATIGVLWASVKMTTSVGNDQGKEDAKKIIMLTVLGMGLAIVALPITQWVCELVQTSAGETDFCVVPR